MFKNLHSKIFLIFQISTIALLLGRGWQFIFKSTPFNSFFFHSVIMDPVVKNIYNISWNEYLTNPEWDGFYNSCIDGLGIYLWFSILLIVFIKRLPWKIVVIHLWSIFFILVFLSFCYFLDKGFQIGQFIEFSLQFCSSLFLLCFLSRDKKLSLCSLSGDKEQPKKDKEQSNFWGLKIATALTFIGHGLYAINFHPRPGYFIDMMIKAFRITENTSIFFLNIVGYLDIIFALALFIPNKLIQKIALYYIIVWGFLTSLARFYSNVNWSSGWYSIKQWLPEFLMRFPHFLLPLVLLIFISFKKNLKSNFKN